MFQHVSWGLLLKDMVTVCRGDRMTKQHCDLMTWWKGESFRVFSCHFLAGGPCYHETVTSCHYRPCSLFFPFAAATRGVRDHRGQFVGIGGTSFSALTLSSTFRFAILGLKCLAGLAPFGWFAHSRNVIAIPMALGVGVLRARSFLRRLCLILLTYTCWATSKHCLCLTSSRHSAGNPRCLMSTTASFLFFSCAFLCPFFVWSFEVFSISRRILPFVCLTVGFLAGFARYRESIRQGPLVVSRSVLWRGLPGTVNLTFGSQPSSSLDFAHSIALWLGYTWCRH